MTAGDPADWKLKLRYGTLQTPYAHFTVLADGVAGELSGGYACRPGRAWMSMRAWATSAEESIDMAKGIADEIGFDVDGRVEVYETEPEQPPGDRPRGYDIMFTPYQ